MRIERHYGGITLAPRPNWWYTMQEARRQACVAVDFYNRPGERQSYGDFVVHMHLAWQNLMHAHLVQNDTNIYFRLKAGSRLYKKDQYGQKQSWDLQTCLKKVYGEQDPMRINVEFFIGIRNSVEHRYDRSLAIATAPQAHAYVINFEAELVRLFGAEVSLADELRFPVFVQSLSPEGMEEQRILRRGLPLEAQTYITEFESRIPAAVREDPRYEYRIRLSRVTGPKSTADLALEFVNAKDLTPEQFEQLNQDGNAKKVLIVNQLRESGFTNEMLPNDAAKAIEQQINFRFSVNDFTKLRHRDGVGPEARAKPAEKWADGKRCIYSKAHNNHVYTQTYVVSLIQELRDPADFETVLGRKPQPPGSVPEKKPNPFSRV